MITRTTNRSLFTWRFQHLIIRDRHRKSIATCIHWETKNLAEFPENREVVLSMRSEMKQKSIELGDKAESQRNDVNFWDHCHDK